jgi:hypothetical protein
MYTSHYANVKNLPESLKPVSISRGRPKWFMGPVELALAPTWKMLKMPKPEYDRHFLDLLAKLDPREIYDRLGHNAVLLCWEKPGEACHRRQVAEWLEGALGVVITEYGFARDEVKAYDAMTWKGGKEAPQKPSRGKPAELAHFLF